MKINAIFNVWKRVFGNWKYALLLIAVALVFYILNALIANYSNLVYYFRDSGFFATGQFFFILVLGFHRTMIQSSALTLVFISLFTGMLLSLMIYKFRTFSSNEKVGFISGTGLFLGFLVPGCAVCGIGIAAVLGLGAGLATLPLKGLELSILAILVLGFAIIKTSNDLFKCSLKH